MAAECVQRTGPAVSSPEARVPGLQTYFLYTCCVSVHVAGWSGATHIFLFLEELPFIVYAVRLWYCGKTVFSWVTNICKQGPEPQIMKLDIGWGVRQLLPQSPLEICSHNARTSPWTHRREFSEAVRRNANADCNCSSAEKMAEGRSSKLRAKGSSTLPVKVNHFCMFLGKTTEAMKALLIFFIVLFTV